MNAASGHSYLFEKLLFGLFLQQNGSVGRQKKKKNPIMQPACFLFQFKYINGCTACPCIDILNIYCIELCKIASSYTMTRPTKLLTALTLHGGSAML